MSDQQKFDFQRHRVVAVPFRDDDPEKGRHFHVSLGEMVSEIKEYISSQQQIPGGTTEIVRVESVPAELEERIGFMVRTLQSYEGRLTTVEARLQDVEARPHLSEATVRELMDGINTRFHEKIKELVASSNGDLRSQISVLKTTNSISRPEPASEQLAKLASIVKATGEYVRSFEQSVEQHNADLEEKYAAITSHLESTKGDVLKVKTMVYRLAAAVRED